MKRGYGKYHRERTVGKMVILTKVLFEAEEGLRKTDIVSETRLSRNTVSSYLNTLISKGMVIRDGKMYHWKDNYEKRWPITEWKQKAYEELSKTLPPIMTSALTKQENIICSSYQKHIDELLSTFQKALIRACDYVPKGRRVEFENDVMLILRKSLMKVHA